MLFETSGGYLAAPGYFSVGKETGEIILMTSVASDPTVSFTVSKHKLLSFYHRETL